MTVPNKEAEETEFGLVMNGKYAPVCSTYMKEEGLWEGKVGGGNIYIYPSPFK